jgi:hypothetical protein
MHNAPIIGEINETFYPKPARYRVNHEIIFAESMLKQPKQHHVAMEPIYCMN